MSNEYKDWLWERQQDAKTLAEKYPFLEIHEGADVTWLDFVPDGWKDTVMKPYLDKLKEIWDILPFLIYDVKEKYGILQIYIGPCKVETPKEEKAWDELLELLSEIREKSVHFCPMCGGVHRRGATTVLCPKCEKEVKERTSRR